MQLAMLVLEVALLAACATANVVVRRRATQLERRAGAPVGGLLDELAFAWVLESERALAAQLQQRLTMLLVVPVDRRWDRAAMAGIVRRNEIAIAVGLDDTAVLVWHADERDLHAAVQRIARVVESLHPMADIGWTSADEAQVEAGALIERARRSRCAAGSLADLYGLPG